jgi:MFS family permease
MDSTGNTAARFGRLRLSPGVMPRHVMAYLWASFVSIGLFAYGTTLQPYIFTVNLRIPPEQRGVLSGDLQFWQEVLALLVMAFIGAWADRVGRRALYVLGFVITAVAYATYPFAQNYDQLFMFRMILAVGVGMLGALMQIVLADYPIDEDRGKLAGTATLLNCLGALIFLGGLSRLPAQFHNAGLSELWAGRAAYLLAGAVCLISAVIMLALKPGRPPLAVARTPILTLVRLGIAAGKSPRIALAYAASFTSRADLVIVALFLSLWVQTVATGEGFSAPEAAQKQGMLFGVVQGAALLWAPVFGRLTDRFDRVTMVIVALILSIVGYGWVGLIDNPLHSSAFPAAIMMGIGQSSGVIATQVLVGQEAPGAIRGAIVGMVGFFGALGILVISKVGGVAYDQWMPGAPFMIMAMANALLLAYALYVRATSPART